MYSNILSNLLNVTCSLFPILSTEIAAASELINKTSSGSNFCLRPNEAIANIASPAPTLSIDFKANPGQEKLYIYYSLV